MIIQSIKTIYFCICCLLLTGATDNDIPKIRTVEINKPITRFTIDILPGRGVKLIFPWILDQYSTELPYTGQLTNSVFTMFRPEGQNHITFRIDKLSPSIEGELADCFINIAGFHFSITLRANFNKKAHYSNVILNLNEADKLYLINTAIKRRKDILESEYKKKEKELDKKAEYMALKLIGKLSVTEPETRNIKESAVLRTNNGKIDFYADEVRSYNNESIFVIPIEINNRSSDMTTVNNVSVEEDIKTKSLPILSEFEIKRNINNNEKAEGFIISRDPRLFEKGDKKISLYLQQGKVVIKW